MNRIHLLALSFIIFVLGVSTTAASAQEPGPEDSMGTQVATASGLAFAHVYLVRATESPTPWWQTSTLVDASGGVHTAFYTNQSIVYAYCSAAPRRLQVIASTSGVETFQGVLTRLRSS